MLGVQAPSFLNILPDSADLPAKQRTDKDEFDDSPFKADPVAAFRDAAAGLLDDDVSTLPSKTDPINYRKAMKLVQRRHWQEAIDIESAVLKQLGVWDEYNPEDIPAGHSTMGSRFTMGAKTNNGSYVHQCNIDSAFPQAELNSNEVVFISLPEGMHNLPAHAGCVLRLCKTLFTSTSCCASTTSSPSRTATIATRRSRSRSGSTRSMA